MTQPNVFVSHSHADDAFAEQLVADLRSAGADAWLDKTDLGAGNFQQRINEALGRCDWFVLVLTRSALASPWVQQEVDAANRLKHQGRIHDLIFMQAGPVEHHELPPLWGVYNIFDATADYAAARDQTLNVVGLTPRAKTPGPPFLDVPHELRWYYERQYAYQCADNGRHALSQKQYDEALAQFELAIKYGPLSRAALEGKAEALSALGREEEAIKAWDEAEHISNR